MKVGKIIHLNNHDDELLTLFLTYTYIRCLYYRTTPVLH